MKVYLLRMRNTNTGKEEYILRNSRAACERFKEDADKDKRYYTYDIEEYEGKSVSTDDTVFAINVYDGMFQLALHTDAPELTYDEFIRIEMGITTYKKCLEDRNIT